MQINLEQQRKRAKDLRRAFAAGDGDAIARVARYLKPRKPRLALSEAQLVIAREAGFDSWPKLKHAAEAAQLPALHAAAARGDLALLALPIANVDERAGPDQWTPLLYACCTPDGDANARVEIARHLLAHGADVNARAPSDDGEALSPLAGAVHHGVALMQCLLDAGASTEHAPALLKHAVATRDLAVLHAAIAAKPPWWQVISALEACADLDLIEQARMLVPHVELPFHRQAGVIRALREERGIPLLEVLLGEPRTVVDDAAFVAAVRYDQRDAIALLRARGATAAVLSDVDRAIAGEELTGLDLRWADHAMLSWVIRKHHFERVPHLLAIGLDPNVHDEAGELPLHHAVRAQHQPTIDQLLAARADPGAQSFDDAVAPEGFEDAVAAIVTGDVAALTQILDEEPDLIHARSPRSHRCTLLHYTTANGTEVQKSPPTAPQIAELLLARGADPNATCKLYGGGSDVLGLMLTSVHPREAKVDGELVRVYAKYGAKITPQAIDVPVQYASPLAVQALVDAGVPVNLLVAASLGRLDLVDETVDVNTRFADGYTALHAAASMGHRAMVEYLLGRGADKTLEDTRWGGTAAGKARYFGHTELAALIDRFEVG